MKPATPQAQGGGLAIALERVASSLRARPLEPAVAIALAAMMLAAIVWFTVVSALEREVDSTRAALTALERDKRLAQAAPPTRKEADQVVLDGTLSKLPARGDVSVKLVELARLAQLVKLELRSLSGSDIKSSEKLPDSVQVLLQVRGSYVQTRAFLAMALNALPSATLGTVSLKRTESGDGATPTTATVDGTIQLTLWMRP